MNFNIADSELTRSILQHNFGDYQSKQIGSSVLSPNSSSPASSARFEDALRSSQQMLERAKLESQLMAEELRLEDEKSGIRQEGLSGIQHYKSPLKLPGK